MLKKGVRLRDCEQLERFPSQELFERAPRAMPAERLLDVSLSTTSVRFVRKVFDMLR